MPLLGPNGRPLNEEPPADAEPVPAEPTGPVEATTAFVVYLLPSGEWQVSDDLDIPLVPGRKPHGDDYTSACATLMRDVQTKEVARLLTEAVNVIVPNTVQGVVQTQMHMAQQAMEAREGQKIAQQLEAEKHGRRTR